MYVLWWKMNVSVSLRHDRESHCLLVGFEKEELSFLSIITIRSQTHSKGSSCLPHLKSWDYCVVRNSSTGESNDTRAVNNCCHLWIAIHPLPIDQIPETFLQVSSTKESAFCSSWMSSHGSMKDIASGARTVSAVIEWQQVTTTQMEMLHCLDQFHIGDSLGAHDKMNLKSHEPFW